MGRPTARPARTHRNAGQKPWIISTDRGWRAAVTALVVIACGMPRSAAVHRSVLCPYKPVASLPALLSPSACWRGAARGASRVVCRKVFVVWRGVRRSLRAPRHLRQHPWFSEKSASQLGFRTRLQRHPCVGVALRTSAGVRSFPTFSSGSPFFAPAPTPFPKKDRLLNLTVGPIRAGEEFSVGEDGGQSVPYRPGHSEDQRAAGESGCGRRW
jgi:hypothetical protein